MDFPIHVTGLDAEGVSLISPASAGFDVLARPLIGRLADSVLTLKPYLVIVSNQSPHAVVAFAVTWHSSHSDGRRSSMWTQFKYPEAICGDALVSRSAGPIQPGHQRIVGNGCSFEGAGEAGDSGSWIDHFVAQKNEELADAVDLRLELDAVIFEDGSLFGPNVSQVSEDFDMYVQAKQRWYRDIIDALDAGTSVEEAFRPITSFVAELRKRRVAGDGPDFTDHRTLWTQQASVEAASWRRRFSDEPIPALLRQTIRLEPFVIRRPSEPTRGSA